MGISLTNNKNWFKGINGISLLNRFLKTKPTILHWNTQFYIHDHIRYATIILNESINEQNAAVACNIWSKAKLRICVDGGTNYFHDILAKKFSTMDPHIITGDFDSIRPEVKELYERNNVNIFYTPDENETDFTKCLQVYRDEFLFKDFQKYHMDLFVVFAETSAERFDHIFGIIRTLHIANKIVNAPVLVISGKALYWILEKGEHHIDIPAEATENSWCGLIPTTGTTSATSTGQKYNLKNTEMSMTTLVSTSNSFDLSQEVVKVTTNKPLLWTMAADFPQKLYAVKSFLHNGS